jgi:DNA-binding NarL/FixJ family response regulator
MPKLRIFLADDHAVVREGLKALVNAQSDMEVVGEAADGRTACVRAAELRPDVVVMDVSMPDMNGVQATRELPGLRRPSKSSRSRFMKTAPSSNSCWQPVPPATS